MTMNSEDPTPWERPNPRDVIRVAKRTITAWSPNRREVNRIELTVPADIRLHRGSVIHAVTRDVGMNGIGLLHRAPLSLDEVSVRLATDSVNTSFRVQLLWCVPCERGLFLSGGRFLMESDP